MDEPISVGFSGQKFSFLTDQKLFAPSRLDAGSKLLLETVRVSKSVKNILDLGCGWGGMGIILAKLHPKVFVYLIDNDPLAIEISKKSAGLNEVRNIKILKADVTYSSFPWRADLIVSNPPWSKNLTVIPDLIRFSFDHLNTSGRLNIVANQKYRTGLQIEKIFGNVKIIAEDPPYKILEAVRAS